MHSRNAERPHLPFSASAKPVSMPFSFLFREVKPSAPQLLRGVLREDSSYKGRRIANDEPKVSFASIVAVENSRAKALQHWIHLSFFEQIIIMSPTFISILIACYFGVLILVSRLTSRKANNATFFLADRSAPWFLVAFGMIGASLSGITFISIPGKVGNEAVQFGYMQMVIGYLVGYIFIAFVLLPLYYKMQLTSIYSYLEERFGKEAYKTGAFYFLLSRTLGASIRLLLVANVLQEFVFNSWNVPFELTVFISVALIWTYTYRGGIKTIIWTDTLQTLFMLISLGVTIYFVSSELGISEKGIISTIAESQYSQWFFLDDFNAGSHFLKQFIGGFFICIGMTGMDQDMMQKNLACKNIRDAQKNMLSFAGVLFIVNLLFLGLGALLFMYAAKTGLELPLSDSGRPRTDLLFPTVALRSSIIGGVGIFFLLGLIAAAYSSADSALTSLTTSVCVDFIGIEKQKKESQEKIRKFTHVAVSIMLLLVIIILHHTLDLSAIDQLIFLAGFTYGPLIGLFLFGIITKKNPIGKGIILICLAAPIMSWLIWNQSKADEWDYSIGPELIMFNALITFVGLLILPESKVEFQKAY